MSVLLISTYEIGRQPFGLASPAAWLKEAGFEVECLDLAVCELDEAAVRRADVIGLYLPMYTATRIAVALLPRLRELNPSATLCAWGLYAPVAEEELTRHGVSRLVGGEFEAEITEFVRRKPGPPASETSLQTSISHARLDFQVPDRSGLPSLDRYARLRTPDGGERVVGSTEATRGCKYLCRHCPVVPIYGGKFRIVPEEVVLADVEQLVEAGAEHVTFGDPDFLNGPGHVLPIVRRMHERFPELTYDVTVKVEHLLRHADVLEELRETGCVLVTSAAEAVDDRTLEILDKGHTREDLVRAVGLCRDRGLSLQPTFVPFVPWSGLEEYAELLETIVEFDLVGQVTPIQLAIRLLVPSGSRLLEHPGIAPRLGDYDPEILGYRWEHPDPRVDRLQRRLEALVEEMTGREAGRGEIFAATWEATSELLGPGRSLPDLPVLPDRATIPYLTEPWYC